jgi:integrase
MQFQFGGKSRLLAFGKYPEVSLADARVERQKAQADRVAGRDPARIEKQHQKTSASNTFEAITREWHENKSEAWQVGTSKNVLYRLEKDVFPLIGKHPIAEIKSRTILDVLRQIEKRGALEMAKRQGQVCGQIFRYAIATGKAEIDPVPALRGALKASAKGHHAAITPRNYQNFFGFLRGMKYTCLRQHG